MTSNWLLDFVPVGILFAPRSFRDADPGELTSVCNGAGTEGLNVPDSFLGLSITDAADIHDWMYESAKTLNDKHIADFVFLVNMLIMIVWYDRNSSDEFWERRKFWIRLKLACVYYVAVNRWGMCAHVDAKKPLWSRAVDWLRRTF
jgi:hypothetical protein